MFRSPPPEGMLVILAGKFRDDVRDALGMKRLEPAYRGTEVRPLGGLTGAGLDRLAKAAGVLLGRFTPFIDDPELRSGDRGRRRHVDVGADVDEGWPAGR